MDNIDQKHIYKEYYDLPLYLQNIIEKFKDKIVWYPVKKVEFNKKLGRIIDADYNSLDEQKIIDDIKEALNNGADINYNYGVILRDAIYANLLNVIKYIVEETNIKKDITFINFTIKLLNNFIAPKCKDTILLIIKYLIANKFPIDKAYIKQIFAVLPDNFKKYFTTTVDIFA